GYLSSVSVSPTSPLIERYRLVSPLGVGGMGRVWLGYDEVLRRDVAVKEIVPPPGLTAAEQDMSNERSLREARAIARLNHPNVVRIYDVVSKQPHPWIVMEYVPSRSLHQAILEDGPLPPHEVARIGLAVLAALCAAPGARSGADSAGARALAAAAPAPGRGGDARGGPAVAARRSHRGGPARGGGTRTSRPRRRPRPAPPPDPDRRAGPRTAADRRH